jgi:hypothetical protein
MQIEAPDIDKDQLLTAIAAEYGLVPSALHFVPKGEEAYAYLASAADHPPYFVRVQPLARRRPLAEAYAVVSALRTQGGLSQVIAPYPTRTGRFLLNYGPYAVAVFPFVAGSTLYEQGPSDNDLVHAAQLLAAVHQSRLTGAIHPPYQESFANPFEAPIRRALALTATGPANAAGYQRAAGQLLAAEREDLLATLQLMRQFPADWLRLDLDWVLTHGDPNLDNLRKDRSGRLYLTDWGEVGIGPPERDLYAFIGEGFETFLRAYRQARGSLKLHPAVFAFYAYRWTMQEIADYTTRLLVQNLDGVEQEHAWRALRDYLPVRHEAIAEEVRKLEGILSRVLG